MQIYDVGDKIRITATFVTIAGAADPTTVTFRFYIKSNLISEHVFGVDPDVIRDAVGVYHIDYTIPTPARWSYQTIGTGAVVASDWGHFVAQGVA